MKNKIISHSETLFKGIEQLIETARKRVAVFVNAETTMLYWRIGDYFNKELLREDRGIYGAKILATVSQDLMKTFGKGYSYSALTRMCKVAKSFDLEIVATLSQQLSWSHFIELGAIESPLKREFYSKLCVYEKWNVRSLRDKIDSMVFERTAISSKPEQTIQSALPNLKKEVQDGEGSPIGLLLCSEGNTEHIELLILDQKEIKVAQYLTELPDKKWFANKLHRAMEIAKSNQTTEK